LGPNGAGKSTFLKLALGLLEPSAGHLRVFGEPAREISDAACARIATILDGHEPPGWATMRMLAALQAEASTGLDKEAVVVLLADRGIAPNRRYGRLSKGQKRYALTSICLAGDADLLLLDEPADGLDTETRRELYDRIRERANERETTVLLATHHIYDIERVADDVLLLSEGCSILFDSLETLREQMREIAVPAGSSPPEFCPGVDLVRVVRQAHATRYFVRLQEGMQTAQVDTRNGAPEEHNVDLETLYLALTQRNGASQEQKEYVA
jgi:ABC-2 type transport system ATP-binding protein